jgi:hypothetical protein
MNRPGDTNTSDAALLDEARARSIALLRRNLSPSGILAATASARASARHYDTVFGRDAAICALAMARSGDADLLSGAVASLDTLARAQANNGQIPKFVYATTGAADFWYVGCIDATLWWLIAVAAVGRDQPAAAGRWKPYAQRALAWCLAQEHQGIHLVQQNEASDWADIMPRSGFVLYSNALWYLVKRLYSLPGIEATRGSFNALFYPYGPEDPADRRVRVLRHYARRHARNRGWYLSFVNLAFCGNEGDTLGNALAVLAGAVDEAVGHQLIQALSAAGADRDLPVRATCIPIARDDPLWRGYMGRHRQNLEHQYHNGGIWPMVGGFWVMALAALGLRTPAQNALLRLAQAVSANDWAFQEWFHGRTLAPHGMTGQSWSAAGYLLAHFAQTGPVYPFAIRGLRAE